MSYYIRHEDTQTPENGVAYFGPFLEDEIEERLNDAYADALAGVGEVEAVFLDLSDTPTYVNSRDYWMTQLAGMED